MIPALVALLILFVALFPVWFENRRRKRARERAREVLLELAPRLSIPGRLNGGTALRFDRRGFPAAVSIHAGARLNVEVSFRLQEDDAGWLTVASLGFRRALLEQVGIKDLQVGDAEFDERFEVWGLDEGFVRRRLGREIRGLLLQVDRRWDFLVRLTPEQLSIRARVLPLERFQVETLTGIAYQLLDLLNPTSPSDFTVSKMQERLDDGTRCPVCGTPLSRGAVVRCAKCRGAHHADCWQFNGLCATFACGGMRKL